jgi:cytochrome c-type biogenesis protein
MSEPYFLALAFGLGLLGFIEPCSVGANGIFLSRLREKTRATRLMETAKFAVSRSIVLGLFGLLIAFLGGFVFTAQKGFWLVLGILYLALGLAVILNARFE